MKKSWQQIIIAVLTSINIGNLYSQGLNQIQLIDSKYKIPVPFAYVKGIGNNFLVISDKDGFFNLPNSNVDTLIISHIAYKSFETTYEKIKGKKIIQLDEIPIEINPIKISSKNIIEFVNDAVERNSSALHKSMYLLCYRRDIVLYNDTLVVQAIAEIIIKIDLLLSPGNGGVTKCFLKNIIVTANPNFKDKSIPWLDIAANYTPINCFIVRTSRDQDKTIYYTKQDSGDSLIIINVYPRLDYNPNKKYFTQTGRIIVNKRTGRITKIETSLDPQMLNLSRMDEYRDRKAERYLYHYSISESFIINGLLSNFTWKCRFSYKENNPNKLWENRCEMYILRELKKDEVNNQLYVLKHDTALIQMRSLFKPQFKENITNVFN